MYRLDVPEGKTADECKDAYAVFLSDDDRFDAALAGVLDRWPISCEHFLTNESLNRVAWLGQASMTYATGIPRHFRAGFKLLDDERSANANEIAARHLRTWIETHCNRQLKLWAF